MGYSTGRWRWTTLDPAEQPGIVLIAHGSRQPAANQDLFDLGERLRGMGLCRVFPSFLELAEPTIPAAGDAAVAAGAKTVILSPYFLSEGRHVAQDLEQHRRDLAERHPGIVFRLAGPLGPHRSLDWIMLERIDQALGRAE